MAPEAFAVLHVKPAGTGAVAMVKGLYTQFQRANQAQMDMELPENLRWIARWSASSSSANARQMASMLPELVVSFTPAPEPGPPGFAAVTQLNRLPRGMRMLGRFFTRQMASSPGSMVESYRGETLLRIEDGKAFCLAGSSLLLAGDMTALKGLLDRAAGDAEPGAMIAVLKARAQEPCDAYLEAVNRDDALRAWVPAEYAEGLEATGLATADLEMVFAGLQVPSEDRLVVDARMTLRDGSKGEAWASFLEAAAEELLARPAFAEFETGSAIELEGTNLVVHLEMAGIQAGLARGLNHAFEADREQQH